MLRISVHNCALPNERFSLTIEIKIDNEFTEAPYSITLCKTEQCTK